MKSIGYCFVLFLLIGSVSAQGQILNNYSSEVETQIKYNSDNGLEEFNNIQKQYTVSFDADYPAEQLAGLDSKLLLEHGDIILSSSSRKVGDFIITEITTHPSADYGAVKQALSRFGFEIKAIETSYTVAK